MGANNIKIIICFYTFSNIKLKLATLKKCPSIAFQFYLQHFENLNNKSGRGILAKWIFCLPCVFYWLSWPELTSYQLLCQT